MNHSKESQTGEIASFIAQGSGDDGNFQLAGYKVVNLHTNCRLALTWTPEKDLCCIAVTDLNDNSGHHVFLPTEVLKDLIGQFAIYVETAKESKQ